MTRKQAVAIANIVEKTGIEIAEKYLKYRDKSATIDNLTVEQAQILIGGLGRRIKWKGRE